MKLALIQSDIEWERPDTNFERLREDLASLAHAGVDLAILPEMFAYGFSMASEQIAEAEDGPSTQFLRDQARELGIHLCGSLPRRSSGERAPTNTFVAAAPDGRTWTYDKIHPFSLSGEHEHYLAGERVTSFSVEGTRVTPFICYDLRFANVFWDCAHHTDLFVVVANWPRRRQQAWSQLLRARAIENQAFVAGVNRVGTGDGIEYTGGSAVIDPLGETLVEAAQTSATMIVDIDIAEVARIRRELPFACDRKRPGPTPGTWR